MELIKIQEKEGKQLVSAREVYEQLGYDLSNWKRWYKKNIINNDYAVENEDYSPLVLMTNGNETLDFVLTLDFAKRLAMMAKTEKGEEVRKYFIECEKKAKENNKPMSVFDFMQQSLNIMKDQDAKINSIQNEVRELKASTITSEVNYFTIMGYASLHRLQIDIKIAMILGKKSKGKCNELGYSTGKTLDHRFGTVNTYPKDILEIVFNDYFKLN